MSDILALDLGTKRIGVARASGEAGIPEPLGPIIVDGREFYEIEKIIKQNKATILVVGLPRNSKGQTTNESKRVLIVLRQLRSRLAGVEAVTQDESLTSIGADSIDYKNASRDSLAACIILQDYLEERKQ